MNEKETQENRKNKKSNAQPETTSLFSLLKNTQENSWNQLVIINFSSQSFESLKQTFKYFSLIKNDKKPIQILNEMFLYFNLQNYHKVIEVYIENLKADDFLLNTNGLFCLIEICLHYKQNLLAKIILDKFEKNLSLPSDKTDEVIRNYLNDNETYNQSFAFREIILIYKCYIHLNEDKFDKARKNLEDFSNTYKLAPQKKLEKPLYKRTKLIYNMLKIKLDFLEGNLFTLYKHLDSFYMKETPDEEIKLYYYYNSYGIVLLKNRKFHVAKFYFDKCLKILKDNFKMKVKFWLMLRYNISLCKFYCGEYKECYEEMKRIKDNDYFENNPFIYYRMGVCLVEIALKDNKEKRINEAIDYFNKAIVIIQTISKDSEKNKNQYFLKLEKIFEKSNEESIFKQKKSNINNFKKNNYSQTISQIHFLSLLNLLFCLNLNKSYQEIIYCSLNFLSASQKLSFKLTEKMQYKINNFLVLAYIALKKYDKAEQLLSQQNSNNKNDFACDFYSSSNAAIIKEIRFGLSVALNLINLNFYLKKYDVVKSLLQKLLKKVSLEKNTPLFVINQAIYYCLKINQKDIALEFQKNVNFSSQTKINTYI